jgi:hypothetical protein
MREQCYICHKPRLACVCGLVTPCDNRSPLLILQHPRERFHALGTARLLRLGLSRAEVRVWPPKDPRCREPLPLPPGAALLYPSAGARRLDLVPAGERPKALVVLDATWPHARAIYRATPWLHEVPHVALSPTHPS